MGREIRRGSKAHRDLERSLSERRIYESSLAWNASRPDTMMIACVDGRWRSATDEFTQSRLGPGSRADHFLVPGGIEPLTLTDQESQEFEFLRQRLEVVLQAHGTHRIIAIAHQDCAWYRSQNPGIATLDLRRRQISDLGRAAAHLRRMFPEVEVETYFASLSDSIPPRIVFDII